MVNPGAKNDDAKNEWYINPVNTTPDPTNDAFHRSRYKQVTICPCCGFKFSGALMSGCKNCGARAVGEALPRPARELPSYGRSLVLIVSGSLMALVFVTQTIMAMVQHYPGSFGFCTWVAAGETTPCPLKFVPIPLPF